MDSVLSAVFRDRTAMTLVEDAELGGRNSLCIFVEGPEPPSSDFRGCLAKARSGPEIGLDDMDFDEADLYEVGLGGASQDASLVSLASVA